MVDFYAPLSVSFVYHYADKKDLAPVISHCLNLFQRDPEKPFSRAMNLPLFIYTTSGKRLPPQINSKANKSIVFIFISKYVVADSDWSCYISKIADMNNVVVVPVALDETAFNIDASIRNDNFIRAYQFNSDYKKELFFISIAHEIYRFTLNDKFEELKKGNETALKLFLSHAKTGSTGLNLAEKLKRFIDNSTMNRFFDATDIAPAYKFNEEILNNIKDSTLIAIHSDPYSSRYWCQKEIMFAKENERPIIAVDLLEEFEDRRFPYASNIPGVHICADKDIGDFDLYRILSAALLETIHFFYAKKVLCEYQKTGLISKDATIVARPPELSDIKKVLKEKIKEIVYPEPPVYEEESFLFKELDVEVKTLLSSDELCLKNKNIGISISDPTEEELLNIGQTASHLHLLSQDVARHLLARKSTLIYGGDLRAGGFTEFLFNEASVIKSRLQNDSVHLKNYIAWPIYKSDTETVIDWKAKYKHVASMLEINPPEDIEDLISNKEVFLPPENSQNCFVWSRCLTDMREKMIAKCDVRICAGGKHSGYKGKMPGVLEEVLIAINNKKPLFLLGGFGGVTSSVCKIIEGAQSHMLNEEWQIQNNPGLKDMLDFGKNRKNDFCFDYNSLLDKLKFENLNNGLTNEDNKRLFATQFIDEAIFLILKGLKTII